MASKKSKKLKNTKKKTASKKPKIKSKVSSKKIIEIPIKPIEISKENKEQPHTFFAVLAYLVQIINYTLPAVIGLGSIISLLIYLASGKNFVKFHALQATFLGIVVSIATYVMRNGFIENLFAYDPYLIIFFPLFAVGFTLIFILMALKASKTEWVKLPLFGDISMKFI
ncbi:MAG: hypothetical protein WC501_01125 [Candidatus Micrarchaeia archaeon]|jgi:uncharacterized membrane protein